LTCKRTGRGEGWRGWIEENYIERGGKRES
jgi:hypothetical protein